MSDVYESYRPPPMPIVVIVLAVLFVGAFLAFELLLGPNEQVRVINRFAVIPMRFDLNGSNPFTAWYDPFCALLGHVFLHGGYLHVGVNTLAFLQGAPFVARRLGDLRFLLLFFLSAIGGGLAYVVLNAHSDVSMVGASGAICGVFGAYFLAVRPTPRAALADPVVRNAIVMFVGINIVLFAFLPIGIAWQAHLGGFITGAIVYLLIAPRYAPRGPWG